MFAKATKISKNHIYHIYHISHLQIILSSLSFNRQHSLNGMTSIRINNRNLTGQIPNQMWHTLH